VKRAVATSAAALLLLGPAACGGDDGDAFNPSTVAPEDVTTTAAPPDLDDLPPQSALDLESIYGDQLADLGLKLTERGGLIDRTGGGYEPSAQGTHLALYVQPTGARNVAQYLEGIRSVGAVFADVFDRWPGLESFDVCQEPVPDPSSHTTGEPLPITQIELTRDQAEAIDFDTVTVVDLVRLAHQDPPAMHLRVGGTIARNDAWLAILDAAGVSEG
jgi:hypothetical protein